MKAIKLFLNYNADEKCDNKLFEGLLEIQKCIDGIDDLFIDHLCITPLDDEE